VTKAIELIRKSYDKPIRIAGLARQLGMSASGLQHHFKAVTAMSPLQFQKQLRLQEARRLLVEECESAGSITLARFRDLLGTSRKPAQLLLERFDADGITRRQGDERVLRRKARTG
jgi:AraC-like DNA-binding protein